MMYVSSEANRLLVDYSFVNSCLALEKIENWVAVRFFELKICFSLDSFFIPGPLNIFAMVTEWDRTAVMQRNFSFIAFRNGCIESNKTVFSQDSCLFCVFVFFVFCFCFCFFFVFVFCCCFFLFCFLVGGMFLFVCFSLKFFHQLSSFKCFYMFLVQIWTCLSLIHFYVNTSVSNMEGRLLGTDSVPNKWKKIVQRQNIEQKNQFAVESTFPALIFTLSRTYDR